MSETVRVGQYEIKTTKANQLGSGSFGIVYKGIDTDNDEPVAAKLVKPFMDSELWVNTFNILAKREVDILERTRSIEDRCLLKIFYIENNIDADEFEKKNVWFISEFCDLGDLNSYFKTYDIKLYKILNIVHKVCSGLHHLHSMNPQIIHRDVKPSNILMISVDGCHEVRLCDFGIAREIDGGTLTQGGHIGTKRFQAPELFDDSQQYTEKVDVFALGITLLQMLLYQPSKTVELEKVLDEQVLSYKGQNKKMPCTTVGQLMHRTRAEFQFHDFEVSMLEDNEKLQNVKSLVGKMISLNSQRRIGVQHVQDAILKIKNSLQTPQKRKSMSQSGESIKHMGSDSSHTLIAQKIEQSENFSHSTLMAPKEVASNIDISSAQQTQDAKDDTLTVVITGHGVSGGVENYKTLVKEYMQYLEDKNIDNKLKCAVFPVSTRVLNIAGPVDMNALVLTFKNENAAAYLVRWPKEGSSVMFLPPQIMKKGNMTLNEDTFVEYNKSEMDYTQLCHDFRINIDSNNPDGFTLSGDWFRLQAISNIIHEGCVNDFTFPMKAHTSVAPDKSKIYLYNYTILAKSVHIEYIMRVRNIQSRLSRKYPYVEIKSDNDAVNVCGNNPKDTSSVVQLLKDEIKAIHDDLYDHVEVQQVDELTIRSMLNIVESNYTDTVLYYNKESNRIDICGKSAIACSSQITAMLSQCEKENLYKEKNMMAVDLFSFLLRCREQDFQNIISHLQINVNHIDDNVVYTISGSKTEVKEACKNMGELAEKFIDSLRTERVDLQLHSGDSSNRIEKELKAIEQAFRTKVFIDIKPQQDYVKIVGLKEDAFQVKTIIEEALGIKPAAATPKPRSRNRQLDTESYLKQQDSSSKSVGAAFGSSSASTNTKPQPTTFTSYKSSQQIHVLSYDITQMHVDVIVNAANAKLIHGGGVAMAIATAAGQKLEDDCFRRVQKKGDLAVTDNYISTAGNLPCKKVMHAVGPDRAKYHTDYACNKDLYRVFTNCLHSANDANLKTIAFPAISSGIYGVPLNAVAQCMSKAVNDHCTLSKKSSLKHIYLVDIREEMIKNILMEMDKQPGFSKSPAFQGEKPANIDMSKVGTTLPPVQRRRSRSRSFSSGDRKPITTTPNDNDHNRNTLMRQSLTSRTSFTHSLSNPNSSISTFIPTTSIHAQQVVGVHDPGRNIVSYASVAASGTHTPTIMQRPSSTISNAASTSTSPPKSSKAEDCPICMCPIDNPKVLDKCKHVFCKDCIEESFQKTKKVCPICNTVYGEITGDQPKNGTMNVDIKYYEHLPGYFGDGTIVIKYYFPGGIQKAEHPKPGKRYSGTSRIAYLPNNFEGKKVLDLLKIAFARRLVFTVGRSVTSGQDDIVTWNDIHHKTNPQGGPERYGYPDPGYLKRVTEELAAKGVK